MIAIRNVRKIVLFAKVPLTPIHANSQSTALLNKTKPVQQIVTRNASIHTRNFLIQKFRLEHISNLGIALLVRKLIPPFVNRLHTNFISFLIQL